MSSCVDDTDLIKHRLHSLWCALDSLIVRTVDPDGRVRTQDTCGGVKGHLECPLIFGQAHTGRVVEVAVRPWGCRPERSRYAAPVVTRPPPGFQARLEQTGLVIHDEDIARPCRHGTQKHLGSSTLAFIKNVGGWGHDDHALKGLCSGPSVKTRRSS